MREQVRGRVSSTEALRLVSSLVLAFLLWAWVTASNDPQASRTFTGVAIAAEGLPDGLEIVDALPTAEVRVEGPESVVGEISAADIAVSLDLRDIEEPGEREVRVVADTPEGVWDTGVSPSRLRITVEETISRQLPLEIERDDTAGGTRRLGQVAPEVSEVTVRGLRRQVERVDRVVLPVEIGDANDDFSSEFAPVALDAEGQPIPEVEIAPARVATRVEVETRGKSVAVLTQLVGEPAEGYEVVDRTLNPATVLIDGPAEVLAQVIAVSTEPIDVSGVTTTVSRSARLIDLPPGVRILEPASGIVDVVVQVRQRGVRQPLPGQPVQVTNLAAGLTATVNPPELVVVVVAAENVLSGITSGDLAVIVDAQGLGPGRYTLRPRIVLPSGVQWTTTEPETVTVTIQPAAATPSADPDTATALPPQATPINSLLP